MRGAAALLVCCALALAACERDESYIVPTAYAHHHADGPTRSNVQPGMEPPPVGFASTPAQDADLRSLWTDVARDMVGRADAAGLLPPQRGWAIALVPPPPARIPEQEYDPLQALYGHWDYAMRAELERRGYRLVPVGDPSAWVTLQPHAQAWEPWARPARESHAQRGEMDFVLTLAPAPWVLPDPWSAEARAAPPPRAQGRYTLPSYGPGPQAIE